MLAIFAFSLLAADFVPGTNGNALSSELSFDESMDLSFEENEIVLDDSILEDSYLLDIEELED